MGVIIGSSTTVSVSNGNPAFKSVRWGIQVQTNKLWVLGSWDPFRAMATTIQSVEFSCYAGGGTSNPSPIISMVGSNGCSNGPNRLSITIVPAACGTSVGVISGEFFVGSYSYQKQDPVGFGMESYSLQRFPGGGIGSGHVIFLPVPTYVLTAKGEGTASYDGAGVTAASVGIVFDTGANSWSVSGSQGSVEAGNPGIGTAMPSITGPVVQCGNGTFQHHGMVGQAQAQSQIQPLYLG